MTRWRWLVSKHQFLLKVKSLLLFSYMYSVTQYLGKRCIIKHSSKVWHQKWVFVTQWKESILKYNNDNNVIPISRLMTYGIIPFGQSCLGFRDEPLVWTSSIQSGVCDAGRVIPKAWTCSLVSAMSPSYNGGTSVLRSVTSRYTWKKWFSFVD